jgi:Na+/melibiose symporter-like transporter
VNSTAALSRKRLGAYGVFALPLAMALLPVYVHAPKLYADDLGLSLTSVGLILLAARLLDALQDPLLGRWSDLAAARGRGRLVFIVAGVPLLAIGLLGMFHPPQAAGGALALWFGGCLVVTYLGFSTAAISYFALGAELSADYHERTRVTAVRGAIGVLGVLAAAALPEVLSTDAGAADGLRRFSLLFVPILLVTAGILVFGLPAAGPGGTRGVAAEGPFLRGILAPLANRGFRWLLSVFVLSGVASAVPAALILFYVQDVLGRADLNAAFLGLYFVFGAAGMPLWVGAARRVGKKAAWLVGMVMSVGAFAWAFLLGPGDVVGFGLVCALSGIAYGAELALPPSILADIVDRDRSGGATRPDGAYFGLWQLTEKLNLAIAAGLALPALQLLGYQPGTPQAAMGKLSLVYALVPCALKLAAAGALWLAPVERRAWSPVVSGELQT